MSLLYEQGSEDTSHEKALRLVRAIFHARHIHAQIKLRKCSRRFWKGIGMR